MHLDDLAGLDFSYDGVGATATGDHPDGYDVLRLRERIGTGPDTFARAAAALLGWQVQQAAGLRMQTSGPRATVGTDSLGRLGVGPIGLPVPCRVVWAVDEPDRAGFAYGTLTGHPERGEESFVVTLEPDGAVWFTVEAFSRHGHWTTRLAGPLGRVGQRLVARRYVACLRRLAAGDR